MKSLLQAVLVSGIAAASMLGVADQSRAKDLTIATSMPALEFPFFVHMQDALNQKAKDIGGITLVATDGQNKTTKQTGDVEAAVIKGVDGIIISPLDAVAMAPALSQAVEAGVPVVTIDRRVEGVDGILAHVGADNVVGGEAQGHLIEQLFPDGARIVNLQGQPGSSPAIDRNKGLHNVLDKSGKYKFVAEQTANFARAEAASVTEAILGGLDSPPDAIVAANDDMALGALQVAQERGLNVPILGFDALPEALASIRDGGLKATVEQFPGGQSEKALETLVGYLSDGKQPEKLILLQPIAITKDNLDKAERLGEIQ